MRGRRYCTMQVNLARVGIHLITVEYSNLYSAILMTSFFVPSGEQDSVKHTTSEKKSGVVWLA